MSIFYICGKPGGGKSYLGVKQIIEELSDPKSDRFIVTNIVLNLAEIAVYLHENVKHEVNLDERVRVLDDAEAGEFWLYEPHRSFERRKTISMRRRSYEVPDFEDRAERGTLYVIDEVHNYFGARDWQNTGNDCTFFLTQHRKLLCDVIFITQHPEQTDKALRRLAQEYMSVRNLSREPILGFNLASWFGSFRYVRSLNSPQSPNPAVFESGFVPLKPELYGKFYDTMQGVGIAGRVVPKQSEARGRSLWWLMVPVVLCLVGGWFFFTHLRQINHGLASGLQHVLFKSATNMVNTVGLPVALPVVGAVAPVVPLGSGSVVSVQSNDVFCVGYSVLLGDAVAWLSDGSKATEADGLEKITRVAVWISGRKYPIKQRVVSDASVGGVGVSVGFSGVGSPASSVGVSVPTGAQEVVPVASRVQILPGIHSVVDDLHAVRLNGIGGMRQAAPLGVGQAYGGY